MELNARADDHFPQQQPVRIMLYRAIAAERDREGPQAGVAAVRVCDTAELASCGVGRIGRDCDAGRSDAHVDGNRPDQRGR